jgi:two-component system cell cycle sensor histidine kinase/response regulator CckA
MARERPSQRPNRSARLPACARKAETPPPPSGAAPRTSKPIDKRDAQIALLEQRLRDAEASLSTLHAGRLDLVAEGTTHEPAVARTVEEAIRAGIAREIELIDADRSASLGSLAAGTAHRINNPLAYIAANASFALEELTAIRSRLEHPDTDRRLHEVLLALAEACEGAERIREIVLSLKTFSRAGDEREPIDIRVPMEIACEMAEGEIGGRARLVRHFGDVPPVSGSGPRFSRLFYNLLINAAQALPHDGGGDHEITVTTKQSDFGGVVVEVRDTGRGIAPESLARIFDPFVTLNPVGQSMGLGLAISQNIVHSYGGNITVESEVGRGSTFRVAFAAFSDAPSRTVPPGVPNMRVSKALETEKLRPLVRDTEASLSRKA